MKLMIVLSVFLALAYSMESYAGCCVAINFAGKCKKYPDNLLGCKEESYKAACADSPEYACKIKTGTDSCSKPGCKEGNKCTVIGMQIWGPNACSTYARCKKKTPQEMAEDELAFLDAITPPDACVVTDPVVNL